MFSQEELNNLVVFMNQAQLQGNQSTAHALLLQKLHKTLLSQPEAKEEKKGKEERPA